MIRASFLIEDELFDMIRKLSLESGLSMSEFINGMFRYYFDINNPDIISERLDLNENNL